ncbi:MAG: DUF4179 domain-containing protein [Oscillospiraceae bacterium]|nr:DUF4179 domain-containing protein [Oscillospiraceae bacterium]MBQ7130393.1 DUF4179 domain-containing protein [Oscillospiraceae bacterium]
MKRRISDMLDGFPAEAVELQETAPLSSQRIKELTMRKIEQKEKKSRRIGVKILALAAAISMLGVTAFAAEEIFGAGDFFRSILGIQLQESRDHAEKNNLDVTYAETISEEQIEVVNQLGQVFETQSFTDQGTTMTMTAAYADENIVHMYLKLEAPEGTVLPDDILYTFCDWNRDDDYCMITVGEGAPYESIGFTSDCIKVLPDADPTDNKKEFLVTLTNSFSEYVKFNDGHSKYLNVAGIYRQDVNVDGDDDGYTLLAPGEFTFDFGLVNGAQAVELDVKGLTYGGDKTRTWTHDSPCDTFCDENLTGETEPGTGLPVHSESWNYTVTAKKLSLSSLSASWECSYECDDRTMGFGLSFRVILKDGSTVPTLPIGGMWDGDGTSGGTTYFAVPIDLEQVDHILLGDSEIGSTHKIYLP